MRICHEVTLDYQTGVVTLDDLELGLWIAPDPLVELPEDPVLPGVVWIGIQTDNIKVITREGDVERPKQADLERELAWARQMAKDTVIAELAPVLRWLRDGATTDYRQRWMTGSVPGG